MQTLGYVRVSKDTGEAHLSPDVQASLIRDYCASNRLAPVDILPPEIQSGGKVANRPIMRELLERAQAGLVAHVVVQDITRAFRSVKDGLAAFEMLAANGARLHSVVRPIDTSTADGEFTALLDLLLSQRERKLTGERIRRVLHEKKAPDPADPRPAMAHKARQGQLAVGRPPYGLQWQDKALVPRPGEIEVVQGVLRELKTGAKPFFIAADLNARGIPTRHGKLWSDRQIRRIAADAGRYQETP